MDAIGWSGRVPELVAVLSIEPLGLETVSATAIRCDSATPCMKTWDTENGLAVGSPVRQVRTIPQWERSRCRSDFRKEGHRFIQPPEAEARVARTQRIGHAMIGAKRAAPLVHPYSCARAMPAANRHPIRLPVNSQAALPLDDLHWVVEQCNCLFPRPQTGRAANRLHIQRTHCIGHERRIGHGQVPL